MSVAWDFEHVENPCQQMCEILQRCAGHTTVAVHRSDTAQRAMPPWTEVAATLDVVCKLCERLDDVFPVAELDVVVVGIFHQVCATRALLASC